MTLWVSLLLAAAGCYALKLAGVSLPPRVLDHPRVHRVGGLLPVAMLAALIVVELLDGGGRYEWDWARSLGVAAGVGALLVRQGVLTVFVVAVTVTAAARWLG